MSVADAASTQAAIEARIYKKVAWRLLWFLLVMYVINFIDRTNVGFAALTMNKELGISASTFGVAVAASGVTAVTGASTEASNGRGTSPTADPAQGNNATPAAGAAYVFTRRATP
jgi:hypothetical protein